MKKLTTLLLILVGTTGCQSDDENALQAASETAITVQAAQSYVHDFGIQGDEDRATIVKEPQDAIESKLSVDMGNTFKLFYTYTPTPGYTGEDDVYIEFCRSHGVPSCHATEVVRITFAIMP